MSLFEELKSLGVNIDEGMERLMGNVSLYERMLGKFVKLIEDLSVQPGFDYDNYEEVIEKTHTIKGATGNLSITPLYEAYTEIVNLLRANQPEQADEILKKIIPVQTEIVNCIAKYI